MSLSLDTTHSSVEFAVRHMGLAMVRGRFEKFDVDAAVNDQGVPTRISATIDASSINTGTEGRDQHLRSPDFFDVEQYPTITFESTSIERRGDKYVIDGNLTMKGVTKPASLEADVTDFVADPWGSKRIAAEASGKINRTDWGLTWNQVLEAGSLLVGEDVRFNLAVELVQQG